METLAMFTQISSAAVIPVALLLVYVPHTIKVMTVVSSKNIKGYNYNPRMGVSAAVSNLQKKGDEATAQFLQRCQSCHDNSWEAFAMVTAAFLLAKVAGVPEETLSPLATVWLGSRLVYIWLYLTGTTRWKGTARSLVWFSGLGLCLYTMFLASTTPAAPQQA